MHSSKGETLTRGIILNSSVDRDDLVATVVDREGELVKLIPVDYKILIVIMVKLC